MKRFKPGAALLAAAGSFVLLAGLAGGAAAQQSPPSEEPPSVFNTNPMAGFNAPVPAHHALIATSTRPWERPPQFAEPMPAHNGVATIPGASPITPLDRPSNVATLGISR
jgi:hypothetical protein